MERKNNNSFIHIHTKTSDAQAITWYSRTNAQTDQAVAVPSVNSPVLLFSMMSYKEYPWGQFRSTVLVLSPPSSILAGRCENPRSPYLE